MKEAQTGKPESSSFLTMLRQEISTPRGKRRGEIPTVAPDLVVEVLSKKNTPKEMERKLDEYFRAGVRLVWYVDPSNRTVRVFEAVDKVKTLREGQDLTGGSILPGFVLSLKELFSKLEA